MNRRSQGQEMSGTLVDVVRDVGRSLGTLSSAAALFGLLSVGVGLTLLITVAEVEIFGYAVLGLGAILLTISLITSRRAVAETVTGRRGRYGANTVAMTGVFVALVAILNFIAFDNPIRLDVTSTKQFSLAPRTLDVLENLNESVKAIAFFDKNDPNQKAAFEVVDNMLHEFHVRADKFSYEIVNPVVEPNTAGRYDVNQFGQVAFIAEESGNFDVAYGAYARVPDPSSPAMQVEPNEALEQDFVTPLLVVTETERKSIYFLVGHGERSLVSQGDNSYLQVAGALLNENYDVEPLDLQEQELVPRSPEDSEDEEPDSNEVSPTVIVVASPQKDLLPDEAKALIKYANSGGQLMLLFDEDTPQTFVDILHQWGVGMGDGTIVDPESFVRRDPRTPLITQHNPAVDITSDIERTYFPGASSLEPMLEDIAAVEVGGRREPVTKVPVTEDESNYFMTIDVEGQQIPLVFVQSLARTSQGSWLVNDPDRNEPNEDIDIKGPFSTAILIDALSTIGEGVSIDIGKLERSSIVAFGDSDFAANSDFNNFSNGDLFLNAVNHLAGDVALINIRPKLVARREMLATPQEFDIIRYTSWFLVPALMGAAGVLVWWRRR